MSKSKKYTGLNSREVSSCAMICRIMSGVMLFPILFSVWVFRNFLKS
jgi:hypothetical protein